MKKIRMLAIGDSPKLHTGFGTVMKEICKGFHETDRVDVNVYGLLDFEEDYDFKLPYSFYPVFPMDDLGHARIGLIGRKVQPDIIFILTDPGNLHTYVDKIIVQNVMQLQRQGQDYIPPIVAYTPIEGFPFYKSHVIGFNLVKESGGEVCVYCNSAKELVDRMASHIEPTVINHGLDHADFRRYSDEERTALRRMAGLDDFFVIGSIGVNKRTKGFDTIVYAAQQLRENGWDEGIKFYLHTNACLDTMWGYRLDELVKFYGVEDMFLFRQDNYDNYWIGTNRDSDTVSQVMEIKDRIPEKPEERGLMFMTYDFISRINCLNMYLDCSQVEGWGLPVGEAMACGVPVISINDGHVRQEIYSDAAYMLDTAPHRMWTTWHPGIRLALIDPLQAAVAINKLRNDKKKLAEMSDAGLALAKKYPWDKSREQFNEIVFRVMDEEKKRMGWE